MTATSRLLGRRLARPAPGRPRRLRRRVLRTGTSRTAATTRCSTCPNACAVRRDRALARHPGEVALALWFHDAIYDTIATTTRRRARTGPARVVGGGAADGVADRVHALIMATRHSQTPATPDARLLVDIDLAILGAAPARFDEYERQIRDEYGFVPEALFRAKRARSCAGSSSGRCCSDAALPDASRRWRVRTSDGRSLARADAPSGRVEVQDGRDAHVARELELAPREVGVHAVAPLALSARRCPRAASAGRGAPGRCGSCRAVRR